MEYIKIIENGGSKMADAFSVFLRKWRHNEITALVNIIYMLGNFLILSNTLLFKYFSLYVYVKGNLDLANKFSNMTP